MDIEGRKGVIDILNNNTAFCFAKCMDGY